MSIFKCPICGSTEHPEFDLYGFNVILCPAITPGEIEIAKEKRARSLVVGELD